MNQITKITSRFGYIDVYANEDKSVLYAIPNGYVGPTLVKKDLKFLAQFNKECQGEWKYIVDISKAKIVNPINPFLLNNLKDFSKMKEYVVYAPSPLVRSLLKLSSWLNKPDRIIKEKEALQLELID